MAEFVFRDQRFSIIPCFIEQSGRYACAISPERSHFSVTLAEPAVPEGRAGKVVEFDSPEEAIGAGQAYVMQNLMRAPLLERFSELVRRCESEHPGRMKTLRIPHMDVLDWGALRKEDWVARGWTITNESALFNDKCSEAEFIDALKEQLKRVTIATIRVDGLWMQVTPA